MPWHRSAPFAIAVLALLAAGAISTGFAASRRQRLASASRSSPGRSDAGGRAPTVALGRAAYGVSGALRVKEVLPGERFGMPLAWTGARPADAWYRWLPALGTAGDATPRRIVDPGNVARAPARPGVYTLEVGGGGADSRIDNFHLVVKVPFGREVHGYLGAYHIGRYPRRRGRYAPPAGFIEVTRANEDLTLSEHLRLRQFLTHDQVHTWPKYAVVEPRLLEKLELVLAQLNRAGVPARRLHVMSGYRTPQYNRRGIGRGRAVLSRHQYGDAADVWVGGDRIDDLNGDGRRNMRDLTVMLRAVDRVESAHPDLVGGAGTYSATAAHGPFIHIDARGRRARWGGARGD